VALALFGLVIAPVSGRPCVAFQLFVEERNRRSWLDLLELRDAQSFIVADDTGEAFVDTSGPFSLALVPDERGTMGWFDRMVFELPGQQLGGLVAERRIACIVRVVVGALVGAGHGEQKPKRRVTGQQRHRSNVPLADLHID
jgi:hypothetical protein